MTVDQLVALISNDEGEIYPFSYAANMMAANGVNPKLVAYFHDAAKERNRASFDRHMVFSDYKRGIDVEEAQRKSFARLNAD